eukprot:13470-Heterococcus_DN1.PRE.1
MDIQSSSIIRYTITPIYDSKVVPPAAPSLIGYIVIGDLANGKASITAEAVDQLGGFAGIYYREPNSTVWQAAAHTFSLKITQLNGYEAMDLVFDPTAAIKRDNQDKFDWPKLFQHTLDENAKKTGSVLTVGDKLDAFAMTGAPLTNFTSKGNDNLPDIVFVRGVNVWERIGFYIVGVYIMLLFFFAMLVCDFAVVYLAIVLFIKPLEQMARHLKRAQGTTFDLDHLRSLAKRKKFLGFVLALGLASPAISIAFLMWEKNVLHTAFIDRSSSEPGLLAISAKVRPQQLVL